jgi:hypothetical protein
VWNGSFTYLTKTFPNQNLVSSPEFNPANLPKPTDTDVVFCLTSDANERTPKRELKGRDCKVIYLLDIWPEVWWEAVMGQHVTELRRMHAFLPIVYLNEPSYPSNNATRSEMEQYMTAHLPGHYSNWFRKLSADDFPVPKSYEEFGYSKQDLVEMLDGSRTLIENNRLRLRDYAGKYVNIVNGHRVVPNAPEGAERTIYVFGGCITFGAGCPDGGTSSAHLQQLLLDGGHCDFRVENRGAFVFARGRFVFEQMKAMPYKPGDILVFSFANTAQPGKIPPKPGCYHIDTRKLLERPHDWGDNVHFDTSHPNERGQYAVAKTLFDFLQTNRLLNTAEFCPPPPTELCQPRTVLLRNLLQNWKSANNRSRGLNCA